MTAVWPKTRRHIEQPAIQAIPTVYNGVRFRSRTEADWASTFDHLEWHWQYEPGGVRIRGINYLPDFRLPGQRVWCEVKGPTNERYSSIRFLSDTVQDEARHSEDLVVVLRPAGPANVAEWHLATGSFDIHISRCGACNQWCFTRPLIDEWRCRHCGGERLIQEVSYAPGLKIRNMVELFREYGEDVDWVQQWYGQFGRLQLQRVPRPRTS